MLVWLVRIGFGSSSQDRNGAGHTAWREGDGTEISCVTVLGSVRGGKFYVKQNIYPTVNDS